MNPNETIRPWLLACGAQFGIRQAHEYIYPDAETRQTESYCTYQSVNGAQSQVGIEDLTTANAAYTANIKGAREHVQRWQIDLYCSQNGLYELEAFCIAADQNQALRNIFDSGGCAFAGSEGVTNMTTFDSGKIDYHFRLICLFREFVEIGLDEINGEVEKIAMGINDGSGTQEITRAGIVIVPEP
jgi:hypothetical protein